MWFKKKENDIEMSGMQEQTHTEGPPEETEYRPVNWKKIFLSPKYIRMPFPHLQPYADTNRLNSMAHSRDSHPHCDCTAVAAP